MLDSVTNPLVSVVLVTWNRREYLMRALSSVYEQQYRPIEVVVVDSASLDGTVEAIAQQYPEVKVIRLHHNLGCPEGRNIAMANAAGEFIFSLDDDGWLDERTLSLCVERFRDSPMLGIVNCRVAESCYLNGAREAEYYTDNFVGCSFALRRAILASTGYFPSDFFYGAEEWDLALRVLDAGYKILQANDIVVHHVPAPQGRQSRKYMFYVVRNQLSTVIRQLPGLAVLPMLVWKVGSWNLAGLRCRALGWTLMGSMAALVRCPQLVAQRQPIGWSTWKAVWYYRKEARRGRLGKA